MRNNWLRYPFEVGEAGNGGAELAFRTGRWTGQVNFQQKAPTWITPGGAFLRAEPNPV
jgi:hypothetical protein